MLNLRTRTILVLAGTVVLSAAGWSQDAKPTEPEPAAPEPKVELSRFTLGYQSVKTNNNQFAFQRYVKVPHGLTVFDAKHIVPLSEKWPYLSLYFAGGADDKVAELDLGSPAFRFAADYGDFRFYQTPFGPVRESKDTLFRAQADAQIGGHIGAFATVTSMKRDHPAVAPEPDQVHQSLEYTAGIGGNAPGGRFDVAASTRKTSETNGVYPAAERSTVQGRYSVGIGSKGSLEGVAGTTRINQFGLASSTIQNYTLKGDYDFDDQTTLSARVQQENYSLGPTVNAFTRRRLVSGLNLNTRVGKWNVQAGFSHKEQERWRTDQSYVDVPKWNDYTLKFSTRLSSESRLTVRGRKEQSLSLAQIQKNDPRSLTIDERAMGQIKLDYFKDKFTGYLTYTADYRKNSFRDLQIDTNVVTIGGSYELTEKANVFAEASRDSYRVPANLGQLGDYLGDYYTDSINYALGLDYAPNTRDAYGLYWNYFQGYESLGYQMNLRYRRAYRPGQFIELNYAPWRYSDRVFGVSSYDSQIASIRFSVRQ